MIMGRAIWKDGRFSWSAIGVVVFLTVSLLGFDVAWRAISLQFDTLLIYSILVDAAAALALILVVRVLTRSRRQL
jgi:hypothetical protein